MEGDNMAKVSNFIICEDIQNQFVPNTENESLTLQPNIVSPLSSVTPVSIPGNYSFAMFGVLSEYDKNTANEMVISIEDPNGKECFSTSSIKIPQAIEGGTDNFSFAINLRNFVFKYEGKYKIRIKFNFEDCFVFPFDVSARGV